MSIKIHIVFYSMYGHIHQMAEAVAKGAREIDDVEVNLFRVPNWYQMKILEKSGAKAIQKGFAHIPLIQTHQMAEADAIIFGTPTRFGNMCAQMRNFMDQLGGLWFSDRLVGKVAVSLQAQARSTAPRNNDHQFSHHPLSSGHDRSRRTVL